MPFLGEAVQLRAANPREALAGWASYEDVWPAPSNESVEIQIFKVAFVA